MNAMNPRLSSKRHPRNSQAGGVVILVVLSLLVLMTVAAMGMSRNSLREVMIVGSARQASAVRQLADSGLEFSLLWSDPQNVATGLGAIKYQEKMRDLLVTPDKQGSYEELPKGLSDMSLQSAEPSQAFELRLLRLGKLPVLKTSVPDERLYNDIWVTQSMGVMKVGTLEFQHRKEAWLTTPAQSN
ncbi:MAG: hypothetical protein HYZ13_10305 [Acidobacteria bacterium]|nr:hypothetical protein [Acidobacteriota bacterium]